MADKNTSYGQTYLTPAIGEYLVGLFAPETPGMQDAARAIEVAGMPQIQVSPWDGRVLEILLRLVGAGKVVELGTLGAYSAQWIARALPPDGRLWTVEASPLHARVARGVLDRAGLSDRVVVCEGKGFDVLPTLERHGPFDAVFVDADKAGYAAYAGWAADNLRPGGLLIGDNTYLFGRLAGVEPTSPDDRASIESMRGFHELLARDFDGVCIPTPDGLSIGIKK
ncbi:MAG TPA: O-methyltransferase [Chloroflexota bacterium]|nr:O-methyltransferase [Chloroflexota bacterium]